MKCGIFIEAFNEKANISRGIEDSPRSRKKVGNGKANLAHSPAADGTIAIAIGCP